MSDTLKAMISGFATPEGTAAYRERFPAQAAAGHFRQADWVKDAGELCLSSLGLGTYLGEPDEATDGGYLEAVAAALVSGINLLDSAINYRHQRSERTVGAALAQLISAGKLRREEVLVCTKGGYLALDGELPADPRAYFMREYVEPRILDPAEIAGGSHCMSPRFLADQLDRSRRNLQVETIDVYYVHNPESQLGHVPPAVFQKRLTAAFGAVEEAVRAGKVRWYGVATWNAFRVPSGQPGYVPMEAVLDAARAAGGEEHHFRFIQLPFNLAMPQAWSADNQKLDTESVSALEFARRRGIAVVGSATLHQGQLTQDLPEFIGKRLGMNSDAENAIQFARSTPGLVTALIGMSRKEHVAANLAVTQHPPARFDDWKQLFGH